MAISTKNRVYSDPSYSGYKIFRFGKWTAGTRATALVESFKTMHPITVLDWNLSNSVLGTGGSSQWVLAATSSNGTAALGTIAAPGTHASGATVDGSIASVASATLATDGTLDLYSVLSTADPGIAWIPSVLYKDAYSATDN